MLRPFSSPAPHVSCTLVLRLLLHPHSYLPLRNITKVLGLYVDPQLPQQAPQSLQFRQLILHIRCRLIARLRPLVCILLSLPGELFMLLGGLWLAESLAVFEERRRLFG